jgi:hypothetical protein
MARSCNGSTDKLTYAGSPSGDFSVAGWFYPRSFPGYGLWLAFGASIDFNTRNSIHLYTNGSAGLEVYACSDPITITGPTASANTWIHVCLVGNTAGGSAIELFINGASYASGTVGTSFSYSAGTLILCSDGGAAFLDALVDDLRFYTVQLSANEITSIMRGGTPRPQSYYLHWPLWGLHSPEIDLSGNGRLGTLTGTTRGTINAPRVLYTPRWAAIPLLDIPLAQYARPSADTTRDNWEADDGTTTDIFDHIDEVGADDATYIRTGLTPTNDVYVSALSSVTDPQSSSDHVLHLRYGKSASGERIDLVSETRQGYTNEGSQGTLINTKTFTDIPTGWTTDADTFLAEEANAVTAYGSLSQRLVANAVATIAFDAASNPTAGTGNLSWTHTPVGVPKGVLVLIQQEVTAADQVSGVTYGGVAMTEVALSPLILATSTEPGVLYGYFLGSSIPTGAQTVVVTVTGSAEKHAACYSVTAGGDTAIDDTSVLDGAAVTDPSVTLQTTAGRTTFIAAALFSGQNAITSVTPGTDYTDVLEYDFGNQSGSWVRRTANGTGGNITVSWTAASEDAGALAVAIREVAARAQVSWLQLQVPEAVVGGVTGPLVNSLMLMGAGR